jgi:hypothetical protein
LIIDLSPNKEAGNKPCSLSREREVHGHGHRLLDGLRRETRCALLALKRT